MIQSATWLIHHEIQENPWAILKPMKIDEEQSKGFQPIPWQVCFWLVAPVHLGMYPLMMAMGWYIASRVFHALPLFLNPWHGFSQLFILFAGIHRFSCFLMGFYWVWVVSNCFTWFADHLEFKQSLNSWMNRLFTEIMNWSTHSNIEQILVHEFN